MRGEVLHYDEAQGFGFIEGKDGARYSVRRENLRAQSTLAKGTIVEFEMRGGEAIAVFPLYLGAASSPMPGPAVGAQAAPEPSPFGRNAVLPGSAWPSAAPRSTGIWAYFWRGLTENYANFRDRARRKEYWGFYLFWTIGLMAACFLGIVVDGGTGRFGGTGEGPIVTLVLAGLYVLATFIPCLAMVIRRQHDIGLSGWFYLLVFIPYVGSLIIFVFSLIPSQRHPNKWGPVPDGVTIPAPYVPPPPA